MATHDATTSVYCPSTIHLIRHFLPSKDSNGRFTPATEKCAGPGLMRCIRWDTQGSGGARLRSRECARTSSRPALSTQRTHPSQPHQHDRRVVGGRPATKATSASRRTATGTTGPNFTDPHRSRAPSARPQSAGRSPRPHWPAGQRLRTRGPSQPPDPATVPLTWREKAGGRTRRPNSAEARDGCSGGPNALRKLPSLPPLRATTSSGRMARRGPPTPPLSNGPRQVAWHPVHGVRGKVAHVRTGGRHHDRSGPVPTVGGER